MDTHKTISFSPPDITEDEIEAVAAVLRSGWITTGPRTKELEGRLRAFTHSDGFACFSSATAAEECILRALGIGPGDEVITSAYTYTATASVICHVGATPVLCDTAPGSFEMDYAALPGLINERTKAIIPIDIAGRMCDYDALFDAIHAAHAPWSPRTALQKCFDRPIVITDGAHSLGATRHGAAAGSVADFTTFSFHAVKNFTTAEGGGLAWRAGSFDSDELYQQMMLFSLHGQTKDALSKSCAGAWEYDIAFPGWKYNMTDIQAAIGLVQLDRYPALLARRRELIERYSANLAAAPLTLLAHYGDTFASSGHLMLTRINGASTEVRNALIEHLGAAGVAANVHYKPLPMMTAYKALGFDIADFPHAYAQYANEITLPLHTLLSDEDVDYVCDALQKALAVCM
ncbi:MAG: DegT/DnrJ/EryC1/StrS family aminotransferase [Raoultibacter sp.]